MLSCMLLLLSCFSPFTNIKWWWLTFPTKPYIYICTYHRLHTIFTIDVILQHVTCLLPDCHIMRWSYGQRRLTSPCLQFQTLFLLTKARYFDGKLGNFPPCEWQKTGVFNKTSLCVCGEQNSNFTLK